MVDINVGQIAEALNEKMDRNLANTDAIGQAILDGKVEVEALLEQNGYAKFTWKNGNKISKLIIQWGIAIGDNSNNLFPITFRNKINSLTSGMDMTNWSIANYTVGFMNVSTSGFAARMIMNGTISGVMNMLYIAIGT